MTNRNYKVTAAVGGVTYELRVERTGYARIYVGGDTLRTLYGDAVACEISRGVLVAACEVRITAALNEALGRRARRNAASRGRSDALRSVGMTRTPYGWE
jgi:hypothetical protein